MQNRPEDDALACVHDLQSKSGQEAEQEGVELICLEKMALHSVTGANYVTSVDGMIHPDRIMEEHDFLYMLDGTWEIYEEDECYEMNKDDLLILAAGRHHYGKTRCNPGNRHMYIHVRPTSAEMSPHSDNSKKASSCAKRNEMEDEDLLCLPSLLHCQNHPKVRQYFHKIIAEGWSPSTEQENRQALLFSLILCECAELLQPPAKETVTDDLVREVCELVRTTPQTFFSAGEIAGNYYICERTLNNRFIRACGKTFYAFQMETKLEMVRQFLLSQPQAKLHEAALNYGFYDEFHLSKAFKKRYGVPPSEYRKRHGKTAEQIRTGDGEPGHAKSS